MKRLLLAAACALAAAGCNPMRKPYYPGLAKLTVPPGRPAPAPGDEPVRDVFVLLLILDGARADVVYEATAEGHLPNFKKHVFDRGSKVRAAVATFPSVTTSGHQSFLTGLYPGHSGITGLDWFDRSSGRVTDYLTFDVLAIREDLLNKQAPMHPDELFAQPDNLITDLEGLPRGAVYEPFHMDIPDAGPKHPFFAPAWNFITHDNKGLTGDAARRLKEMYSRPEDEIPRFVMATFLGHDVAQHHHGSASKELAEEMEYEDRQLGEIVERMQKAGIWDRTYIILSSDHGQHRTGRFVSIPRLLRDAGLRPRGFYAANVNTFASQIAITSANIYLNKGKDWREPLTLDDLRNFPNADGDRIDLVGRIVKHRAIEFALVPEMPDAVHVFADGGRHGVFTRRSFDGVEWISYAAPSGGPDPLGYDAHPETAGWVGDGRFHSADEWGAATAGTKYPDAPVQLLQLFDGDRAGDIVVTAREGWHFRLRGYESSHGGMGREDLLVPLVLSGPDVARGLEVPFARTADVYPTIRRLFGMSVDPARMDGRPLDELLPWLPAAERLPARSETTAARAEHESYFAALAALEALLAPVDGTGAETRDPARLFAELKAMDYETFSRKLDEETARDTQIRREVMEMRVELEADVHSLARTVKEHGHDEYNDGVFGERKRLKRNRERVYILTRTLARLEVRLARAARLRQVLDLVRISNDVDELQRLFAASQKRPAGVLPEDRSANQ